MQIEDVGTGDRATTKQVSSPSTVTAGTGNT
jgi:hypothetical protein